MAASESISINSSACADLTLEFYPLRFCFAARQPLSFAVGESANWLRGQFGRVLMRQSPEAYRRLFAPSTSEGPSGLRDMPRPFVLRAAHLDGARFRSGQTFEIGVNLFDMRVPMIAPVTNAVRAAVRAELVGIEGDRPARLSLVPFARPISRVRVRFITPTELKGAAEPEFPVLFARIRDRVSTLRALYADGPLPIDFKATGQRAECVRMTLCDLDQVDAERVSRGTGQRHSLGGFIGVAEYQGELAEFVPYLEAARWTGLGRQTVWGKGEIAWEEI
jgi:hypothetical protein